MWIYSQAGILSRGVGITGFTAQGYSGKGEGKNNSAFQQIQNIGPIPQGKYSIGEPHDSPEHGPFAMRLTPDPANEMFGRSSFLMHGDSLRDPGEASEGCIIMSRETREHVWSSGDHELQVTA